MPKQMPEPAMKRLYPKTLQVREFARKIRRKKHWSICSGAFNPPQAFVNLKQVPPFVAVVSDGENSVPRDFDFDWTLHRDKKIELERRAERNQLAKDALLKGKTWRSAAQGIRLIPGCSAGIFALTRQSPNPRSCGYTTLCSAKFSQATASMLMSSSKLLNAKVDCGSQFPIWKAE